MDDDAPAGKPMDGATKKRGRGRTALIGQHFDIGDTAVIIDGHVHIFPAGSFDDRAAIAVNPVADAKNARERFDIEVHQGACRRVLVSMHGRRGGHTGEPIQSHAGQDARDRRARHLRADRNRPGRQPCVPAGDDRGDVRRRRLTGRPMRARRPVLERWPPAQPISSQPFECGSPADAGRHRRLNGRPAFLANAMNDQGAHGWGRLRVTMKLHSGPPIGLNGTCGNAHSFQGAPSEQPH